MPTIEKREIREVGPREWGSEVLIALTPQYMGKVLYMKAGTAGGLQYHREKVETFYLHSGEAIVTTDRGDGILTAIRMVPGEAYHIPAGAVHKVTAVTACVFFEVSTPVFDDRVRCEETYGLKADGGLPTT
jgi:mannose-6-phosphate isomerase-like protein (cupin superfamily)